VTADFAIAADRNDGKPATNILSNNPQSDQRTQNSRNHEQDGQNVLYNDGHVEWAQTAFVGANKDCIYTDATTTQVNNVWQQASPNTGSKSTTGVEPQIDLDTILLPFFR
jgi:prepilin-type processing-associated H-X9-DG protein